MKKAFAFNWGHLMCDFGRRILVYMVNTLSNININKIILES